MSVTIKDIAKELGISHTTVSRALNNSSLIREETKKKVKETAQAMGYSPNYSARALVNARSYNIGLFFSSIVDGTSPDFFHGIIQSVSKEVGNKYNLMVHGIDLFYRELQSHHFDGIILVSQSEQDQTFIESALEKEIPIVVINRIVTGLEVTNIVSDDELGVQQGVEYLISQGHQKIGMIEGKEGFQSSVERKNGYLNALKKHHIPYCSQWCVQGDYSVMSGYLAMKKLLEQNSRPTAIFCANDNMAFGALKVLSEEGIQVPEEMSLLGFDGSLFATYSTPELSTIRKPIDEMSQEAVRELKRIMKSENEKNKNVIYRKTELIIGKTIHRYPK
ncbi:MAG: LacI family transcriptional regulator [Epulopiscium sp.]|nr:LacI family transcriptional regulator [Candidatus Epulonipiscium sp.]